MTGVLAVAVTWNCRAQALALVASLQAQRPQAPDILVVDNASTDGTADAVAALGVEVLRLGENTGGAGGFAAGMRVGAERGHDWLWLCDGDACATPDALAGLLAEGQRHPRAAAIGSRIVMANHPRLIQECGATLDRWSGRPRFRHAFADAGRELPGEAVDYLAACSLLVRGEAVRALGGFDPALFVFFDDVDWSLRARAAGWQLRTAPRSVVHHPFHGGKPPLPWRVYYGARNQIVVHARHRRGPRRWLAVWTWIAWAERWARRWARRGHPELAATLRRAIDDALAGRLGRRDDWPAAPATDGPGLALPEGAIRLLAAGEIGLELGAVAWWRRTQPGRTLEVATAADGPLARLLADEPATRVVGVDAPAPALAIVLDDATPVPTGWPAARLDGERLVARGRAPGARREALACALGALPRLLFRRWRP